MSNKIDVQPSGHSFTAEAGETLLDAALRQNINLPYGCRNGACGACKGKVVAGEVDLGDYKPHALSDEDRAQGMALFCCASAKGDLTVEVKEVGGESIPAKTLPCRVESIERAHSVAIVKLKLPPAERLQFRAGQYIDILLADDQKRSFSIANAPHNDAYLELHVRHQPGGYFSEHVFHHLQPREMMRFKGPLGSFFMQDDSDKPILFLASGTGFAPIKSMIEHAMHNDIKRPMVMYWGARVRDELYMDDLARSWEKEIPGFRYVPVLSESPVSDMWNGRRGLVHEAVLEDFADLSAYQVYACGAPVMVEAAHRTFIADRHLPADEFFSDAFFLAKDMK